MCKICLKLTDAELTERFTTKKKKTPKNQKKKKKQKKKKRTKNKRRDIYDVDDDRQRTTFNQESFFGTSVKSVEPIRAQTLLNYK